MPAATYVPKVEQLEMSMLYEDKNYSIPDLSKKFGYGPTVIRTQLRNNGVTLRSRTKAIQLAGTQDKLGTGMLGTNRTFTEEHKENIRKSKLAHADIHAKGTSINGKGYVQFTRGPHKDRLEHVVIMEGIIGRRLLPNEIVHHKDEVKHNNSPSNLQLLTRSAHARLHALKTTHLRKRNADGTFI